ncbi:MAG: NHL repeat-containing protein [Dehalococcoidia bacterium]|jgi:hypothetical protein|nr:NHL repeat-containing protein [Dehalococcoidia bacterium]
MRWTAVALASLLAVTVACSGGDEDAAPATSAAAGQAASTPSAAAKQASTPSTTAGVSAPAPTYSGSYSDAVREPQAPAPASTPEALQQLYQLSAAHREVVLWGNGRGGVDFVSPNGLAIDGDDNVYVTEARGNRFRKFSPDGEVLLDVGGEGAGPGQFLFPIGIAVDGDGFIYVTEAGGHRVQRFAADGTLVTSWGGDGTEPGHFRSAMGIGVSEAGEVFVADFGNHRVQVFDRDGALLRSFGEASSDPGQFVNPIGLQIGPAGNVWVVDSGNRRAQTCIPVGEFVAVWDNVGLSPQLISLNAAGQFFVSSPGVNQVRWFDADGTVLGRLGLGISGDDFQRLNDAEIGGLGATDALVQPHGTATDSAGNVYLADTGNGVVRKFAPAGG